MGRGAPNKKGLDYFPKTIDFYEDDRIFDLLDRYGPLGVTVYDCILCIVYKHGYYAEIPLDKLSKLIIKMIGNKWVKNQKVVVQVVHFCSEIGLIDDGLMTENIITSVGIQQRFYEIAVKRMKRQLYNDKYWLLKNEEKRGPLLNAPKNGITSEENRIISEENQLTSEESPIENKNKIKDIYMAPPETPFDDPDLEKAFQLYLTTQKQNGRNLSMDQIHLLRKELLELSTEPAERLAIVNKAIVSGWKSFYPLKKGKRKQTTKKSNSFNNFTQREYDFEKLEKDLLQV